MGDEREAGAGAGTHGAGLAGRTASFQRRIARTPVKLPSPVACKCLRHMVEIVSQLADFEHYSQDCISTGRADAALHRQLSRTAGAARTLFEHALQRVVSGEGLELRDAPVG